MKHIATIQGRIYTKNLVASDRRALIERIITIVSPQLPDTVRKRAAPFLEHGHSLQFYVLDDTQATHHVALADAEEVP